MCFKVLLWLLEMMSLKYSQRHLVRIIIVRVCSWTDTIIKINRLSPYLFTYFSLLQIWIVLEQRVNDGGLAPEDCQLERGQPGLEFPDVCVVEPRQDAGAVQGQGHRETARTATTTTMRIFLRPSIPEAIFVLCFHSRPTRFFFIVIIIAGLMIGKL